MYGKDYVVIVLTDGCSVDDMRAVAPKDVEALNEVAAQVEDGLMKWQIAPLQEVDGVIYFLNK